MSLYSPEQGSFELPKNPAPDAPLYEVARHALDWIRETVPLEVGSQNYRPERVQTGQSANCYAQAIAGVALLDNWGESTGIVLDSKHALIVVARGDEIRFVDPYTNAAATPEAEGAQMISETIAEAYQEKLPGDLASGDFIRYFYKEPAVDRWSTFKSNALRGVTQYFDEEHKPHVIVDGAKGIDMLLACGDLRRYAAFTDPTKYDDHYDKLIPLVPDFIPLSATSSYERISASA